MAISTRKHYITLCLRNNTEITHILKNNMLGVTFEQAKKGGFNTLILDDKANVVSNQGFNKFRNSFFQRLLNKKYRSHI